LELKAERFGTKGFGCTPTLIPNPSPSGRSRVVSYKGRKRFGPSYELFGGKKMRMD
jgi:hypothetical protein